MAEVLMIRALLSAQRRTNGAACRALLVVPFLSMVAEKTEHLTKVVGSSESLQWRVKGYKDAEAGSPFSSNRPETLAVCTMEKAGLALDALCEVRRIMCVRMWVVRGMRGGML